MKNESEKKQKTVSKILKTLAPSTTSKKQIKRALEVSEEKYKTAFEYTGTGMMVLDEDMTINLVNQKIIEMTGYSHEEIEGKRKWTELVSEEDLKRMMEYHSKRRETGGEVPMEYEFRYRHKSGVFRDALINVSMIPNTKESLVSLIDITQRKITEKELLESQRRFKETAELLPSVVCEINTDTQFTFVNQIGFEQFGYSQEEFDAGITLDKVMHEDDFGRAKKNIMRIMTGEKVDPEEYRLVHKDGTIKDCFVVSSRMIRDGNVIGLRTTLIDISERKRMEQKLRESEERLRTIYAASPIGIAVFDSEGSVMDMNTSFKKMFGLPDEVSHETVAFSLFEHVSEAGKHKKKIIQCEGMAFESPNDFKLVKNKDVFEVIPTSKRYLNWHITPLCLEKGSPAMFLAQVQDITERKRNEESKLNKAHKIADEANRLVEGLKKEIYQNAQFQNMVSRSSAMQEIFNILPEIAQTVTTVLITGESGTGKELIARSIHVLSPRKSKPFVAINCGALPDNLLESELFGYKAGAFTDAKKDKPGKFALAEGGTLFLDEIGDISPAMQVKLLRVLQEKVFEPLGATKTVTADVRIVAATNQDLSAMVKKGDFREDLYYRVKVLNLALPALRERKGDIPLLCDHFISLFNARFNKSVKELSNEALDVLLAHDYPGNIRELENILEHAFIFCKGDTIETGHLPQELIAASSDVKKGVNLFTGINNFDELEKMFIKHILMETGGSRIQAAAKLNIHKATLFRKMKSLGIDDV